MWFIATTNGVEIGEVGRMKKHRESYFSPQVEIVEPPREKNRCRVNFILDLDQGTLEPRGIHALETAEDGYAPQICLRLQNVSVCLHAPAEKPFAIPEQPL